MNGFDLSTISSVYVGSTQYNSIYKGSTLIWSATPALPYDAEVEYLEGSGTLYIDTGILNDSSTVVDMTMSAYGTNCMNGSEYSSSYRFKWGSSGEGKVYLGYGSVNQAYNMICDHDNRLTYHLLSGSQIVCDKYGNEILNKTGTISTYSTNNITLFRARSGNSFISMSGTMRIYSCSITKTGTSLNLIPVRVGSVGYMYDTVSGTLFGNQGTGAFTVGPDKGSSSSTSRLPSGYTEVQWIRSTATGSQYINLGINLYQTLGTNYDIATKFISFGHGTDNTQGTFFGCQNETSPWPGTFIRNKIDKSSSLVIGRYIGGTAKDNVIGNINALIELPIQTSPDKNVASLNNGGQTHTYGTSLFCAFLSGNVPYRYVNAAVYYFKLFVEGVLVRDLVPCINPSNVVGMYDLANDVFYSSPNGNAFVAGPAV